MVAAATVAATQGRFDVERRADWLHQLWLVLLAYRRAPFAYGQHDCTMLLARCVDAMTGSAFESELAMAYHDARSAVRFLRAEGGLEAAITRRLGVPVNSCFARRGDGLLFTKHVVGVCVGTHALVIDDGLKPISLHLAQKHWRVG